MTLSLVFLHGLLDDLKQLKEKLLVDLVIVDI